MKNCPYCLGEIPDEARKCKHCGEWVDPDKAPAGAAASTGSLSRFFRGRRLDETLNEGVKLYVKYSIVAGAIGLIVFLVFLFAVFIPRWNDVNERFPGSDAPLVPPGLVGAPAAHAAPDLRTLVVPGNAGEPQAGVLLGRHFR